MFLTPNKRFSRWRAFFGRPVILALLIGGAHASRADAQQLMFSSGGGPLTLSITSATAGSQPVGVSDNSTEIFWDADFGVTSKMTISTSVISQSFRLYILLTVTSWASGTAGTPQPEIELIDSMLDTDILRDIPPATPQRTGFGTLRYRASSLVSDGNSAENGDDLHTITFTIVAQ
jgi:hypothetical protein